jgi:hypothetical protein
MDAYQDVPAQVPRPSPILNEQVIVGQIPTKPSYSAEKVVEEVAKRIEAQKAEALKKNKFNN